MAGTGAQFIQRRIDGENRRQRETAAAEAARTPPATTAINTGIGGAPLTIYDPGTLRAANTYYGDDRADQMLADLTKARYNEYKATALPLEEWLQQQTSYMNPQLIPQLAGQAITRSNQAYLNVANQGLDRMRDMGVPMTAGDYQARQRAIDVGRSAAAVDAANRIVQRIKGRDVELATGTPATGEYLGIRASQEK